MLDSPCGTARLCLLGRLLVLGWYSAFPSLCCSNWLLRTESRRLVLTDQRSLHMDLTLWLHAHKERMVATNIILLYLQEISFKIVHTYTKFHKTFYRKLKNMLKKLRVEWLCKGMMTKNNVSHRNILNNRCYIRINKQHGISTETKN